MKRVAVAVLTALLAGAGVVLAASPALAHTRLVSSDPADGSRLAATPTQVVLVFTERLQQSFVAVSVTKDGAAAGGAPASVQGQKVTVPLRPASGPGAYRVAYRVASEDGHPVTGEIAFTAASGSTGEGAPPTPNGPAGATPPPGGTPSAAPTATAAALTPVPVPSRDSSGSETASTVTKILGGLALLVMIGLGGLAGAMALRARRGDGS